MIKVSAPCRIDIGGTWDMDMFSLPYRHINPATITIALNKKVYVKISPYKAGKILIRDYETSEYDSDNPKFEGRNGLISAILSFFNIDGVEVSIVKEYPYQSGLGGSGALAICLIVAIMELNDNPIIMSEVIDLSHRIEEGMRFSYTGYQDQCASAYGGVKLWYWNNRYRYDDLIYKADSNEIEQRLVVAYTGKGHDGGLVNERQIRSFMSGENRKEWVDINQNTLNCADAIRNRKWDIVSRCVTFEHKTRMKIVPDRLPERLMIYEDRANAVGYGFGVCGSGGTVFFLGSEPDNAIRVKESWQKIDGAVIMDSKINFEGIVF